MNIHRMEVLHHEIVFSLREGKRISLLFLENREGKHCIKCERELHMEANWFIHQT